MSEAIEQLSNYLRQTRSCRPRRRQQWRCGSRQRWPAVIFFKQQSISLVLVLVLVLGLGLLRLSHSPLHSHANLLDAGNDLARRRIDRVYDLCKTQKECEYE